MNGGGRSSAVPSASSRSRAVRIASPDCASAPEVTDCPKPFIGSFRRVRASSENLSLLRWGDQLAFHLGSGPFHRRTYPVLGEIDFCRIQPQQFGHASRRQVLQNAVIKYLKMFWLYSL